MTPHKEEIKQQFVNKWLGKAAEDLSLAEHLIAENAPYHSAIGFHAQQAAEKYLKAFMVDCQIEFPKTHDLAELLDRVSAVNASLAESLNEITVLSSYGVGARYPADLPEISRAEAGRAVELAVDVRDATISAMKR
jgi:HEPN domain-containing protein